MRPKDVRIASEYVRGILPDLPWSDPDYPNMKGHDYPNLKGPNPRGFLGTYHTRKGECCFVYLCKNNRIELSIYGREHLGNKDEWSRGENGNAIISLYLSNPSFESQLKEAMGV